MQLGRCGANRPRRAAPASQRRVTAGARAPESLKRRKNAARLAASVENPRFCSLVLLPTGGDLVSLNLPWAIRPYANQQGSTMNQRDLLAAVQKKSGVALKDVKAVVEAFFDTVTKTSRKEPVRTTLGTFVVAKRAARMGRNPQTGEAIKIAAAKKFRFRPSKSTKEAVM
ncbi:MAG: HU family DNA-binding protein [Dongia sp.]